MSRKDETIMDAARRNKAYVDTRNDDGLELAGFMATFHPKYPQDKVRSMMRDARDRQRSRR